MYQSKYTQPKYHSNSTVGNSSKPKKNSIRLNLDKTTILRIIIILLMVILLWLWIFKGKLQTTSINPMNKNDNVLVLDKYYSIDTGNAVVYYMKDNIKNANALSFESLDKGYAKDINNVYYKWEKVVSVNPKEFNVIDQSGNYDLDGIIVNSENLLNLLENRTNRLFLMNHLSNVLKESENSKSELYNASTNAMYNFRTQYNELRNLWWKSEIKDSQRAKYAVMFLYVKLTQQLRSGQITMDKAIQEFGKFLEDIDPQDLKEELSNEGWYTVKGNIGYDNYCLYVDGKLHTCFLNKIFMTDKID